MTEMLLALDFAAAAVLFVRALLNLDRIDARTKHCYRAINIVLAIGAAGVLVLWPVDLDLWIGAHVAVFVALAGQTLMGRRRFDKIESPQ